MSFLKRQAPLRLSIHRRLQTSTATNASFRPFKNKSTLELVNSLLVFRLCTIKPLVAATPSIIKTAERLALTYPLYTGIKATFFKHFCGGEDLKEVAPTIEAFRASGIGSILDLAMEADLDSGVSLTGQAAQEQASKIAVMMKESVDIAATTPGNFIAAKVTAFVPPGTLLRWSTTVTHFKKTFDLCAQTDSNGKKFLDLNGFSRFVSHFPAFPKDKAESHFKTMDKAESGRIDFTDISAHFSLFNTQNAYLLQKPSPAKESLPHTTFANQEDLDTASLVLKELSGLCSYAREKRVKIMIDAEQTYFQPAIDDIALSLCQKFNEPLNTPVTEGSLKSALVYNTYQMYLKDANDRLQADIERASRFGYIFGVKLVRGAYMYSERERAQVLSLPDPIQPDLESTHKSFNTGVSFVLKSMADSHWTKDPTSLTVKPLCMTVASHNQDSIVKTQELMKQHGIPISDGVVSFAQLMGMQDGTTYQLAAKGIKAYKYIPYGPVQVTIPYLHRRAQENASVLEKGAAEDVKNLRRELLGRFTGRQN